LKRSESNTYPLLSARLRGVLPDATTVSGHTTTVYLFHSPQGQVLADLTVSGSNRSYNTYVWGLGYVDDLIEQDTGNLGSSRTYVQQDANHNVTALLSSSGVVTNRFIYDPYGSVTELTAAWATVTGGQGFVYGFQGGRYDVNTGTYYFRSRWYDPATGTWMSQDPAGYVNGANLYQAWLGKPISSVDPYGMDDTRGWAYTSTPDNPVESGSADTNGPAANAAPSTGPSTPATNPSGPTTNPGAGGGFPGLRLPGQRLFNPDKMDPTLLAKATKMAESSKAYLDLQRFLARSGNTPGSGGTSTSLGRAAETQYQQQKQRLQDALDQVILDNYSFLQALNNVTTRPTTKPTPPTTQPSGSASSGTDAEAWASWLWGALAGAEPGQHAFAINQMYYG